MQKHLGIYNYFRLKNPHFPPETTAKITMVNFDISEDGLIDQLLGIIVARYYQSKEKFEICLSFERIMTSRYRFQGKTRVGRRKVSSH